MAKSYEGKATLIVGQSLTAVNPDYNQLLASQRLSQTYAVVATLGTTLQRVIESLDLQLTPDELRSKVSAQAPIDSTLITIRASDVDPVVAAAIANAIAQRADRGVTHRPGAAGGCPGVRGPTAQRTPVPDPADPGRDRPSGCPSRPHPRAGPAVGGAPEQPDTGALDLHRHAPVLVQLVREPPDAGRPGRPSRDPVVPEGPAQHDPGCHGGAAPRGGHRLPGGVPG